MQPVSLYYLVLVAAGRFNYQATDHFLALPVNNDLAMHKVTDRQWLVLADFQVILEVCTSLSLGPGCVLTTEWSRPGSS